ncbi:hypothetical protein HYS50_02530 [Candidatus Woesearchaeota archaeon]|nr:hypothetical protein [Candidatus Woesearchaeota archaeon]
MRFSFLFFFLFLLLVGGSIAVVAEPTVVIYQSESCGHCSVYIKELTTFLEKQGVMDIIEKDIVGDRSALQELDTFTKQRQIPYELQGHMVTIINDLVIEGHVPLEVLEELFTTYPDYDFPELVLFQDSMDLFVTEYTLMEDGNIRECSTERPLAACREQDGRTEKKNFWNTSFFFIVALNALLAGIHPCTISVLLFFIAFLFTLRRSRVGIVKVGITYIVGIFLAYFGIGLGLFKAVTFVETPHFAAKIGALLVLLLGLFNVISYFAGNKWSLGMPKFVKPTIANLLQQATLPAAFVVGIIVGICSFGCTAGIYLSIMSLLLVKTQYLQGVLYLLLYNIMFILPLIIILLVAANKRIVQKLEQLEASESKYLKLISGIVMIILAIIIFLVTYE